MTVMLQPKGTSPAIHRRADTGASRRHATSGSMHSPYCAPGTKDSLPLGLQMAACHGQRTTPAGQTNMSCSTSSGCFSAYCAAR